MSKKSKNGQPKGWSSYGPIVDEIHVPYMVLSDAVEIAVPHLRAFASLLYDCSEEADSKVMGFLQALVDDPCELLPPFRAVTLLERFAVQHGDCCTARPNETPPTSQKAASYSIVQFVLHDFWQRSTIL